MRTRIILPWPRSGSARPSSSTSESSLTRLAIRMEVRLAPLLSLTSPPSDDYLIDETLARAKEALVPDLTLIYDEVAPCFPPSFDLFNMYCSIYHASFNQMMMAWAERSDVSAEETLGLGTTRSLINSCQIQSGFPHLMLPSSALFPSPPLCSISS